MLDALSVTSARNWRLCFLILSRMYVPKSPPWCSTSWCIFESSFGGKKANDSKPPWSPTFSLFALLGDKNKNRLRALLDDKNKNRLRCILFSSSRRVHLRICPSVRPTSPSVPQVQLLRLWRPSTSALVPPCSGCSLAALLCSWHWHCCATALPLGSSVRNPWVFGGVHRGSHELPCVVGRKKTEEEAQDGAFAARRGVEYMRDAAGNTNELRETLKMLEDPAVMREVQEMMRDPKFQAEMEKLTSDPRFKASVQQANELLGETAAADMLADPSVYEQYLRMFSSEKENVARGIKHMHQALADPQEMKVR
eukprot:scaffold7052_cov254-Pinguiococcus_pyrenoidosus.AAC.2